MLAYDELKIAVCDDAERDRVQIGKLTKQILQQAQIPHTISCYESGVSFLADIQKGCNFQIIPLDVLMDEMNGMELAAELRRQQNNIAIIFISSNREMALAGYKVSAARYLAKPLETDDLKEALLYCDKLWKGKKEILLPTKQGQYRISFVDIQFVEAFLSMLQSVWRK